MIMAEALMYVSLKAMVETMIIAGSVVLIANKLIRKP